MSRLSRFKKPPVLKLPRSLPQRNRFDEDSDDDDDFVSRPVKYKESVKSKPKKEITPPPVEDTSIISPYFQTSETSSVKKTNQTSTSLSDSDKDEPGPSSKATVTLKKFKGGTGTKIKDAHSKEVSNSNKLKIETETSSSDKDSETISKALPESTDDDHQPTKGKIFCPFCGKKLSDKLTGTTHIKSCAKDVPVQRIIEAMQLQEKQMEEWEKLGLEFPGLSTNISSKQTKTRPRGGGSKNRRKKDAPNADPEFELALALSMSLHEELETRHTKENQFLIENGLETEVGLVEVKPTPSVPVTSSEKSGKPKNSSVVPTSGISTGRRRRKKLQLDQLPLYTVNSDQQKVINSERVSRILEDTETEVHQEFYISDKIPLHLIGTPKNLIPLHNKASTMWNASQNYKDIPKESFNILDVPGSKPEQKISTKPTPEKPETSSHETSDKCSVSVQGKDTENDNFLHHKAAQIQNNNGAMKSEAVFKEPEMTVSKLRKNSVSSTSSSSTQAQCSSTSTSSQALKSLPRMVQDIANMLILKKDCDLRLYGREEKAIKCHSFMLSARCPKLLNEVSVENSQKGTRRLIPLTNFSHKTLKAFLWYIYTDQLDTTNDDDVLNELKELASTYGIVIDPNALKTCNSVEAQTQTDTVTTQNSSTCTESMDKSLVETGLDSSTGSNQSSQELFTTFYEKQNVDSDPGGEQSNEATVTEDTQLSTQVSNHDSENEDALSSEDLFADIENDMKNRACQSQEEPLSNLINCTEETGISCNPSQTFSQEKNEMEKESLGDDEEYFQELESPNVTRSSSCEKKRSRSATPPSYDFETPYGATQLANILQYRAEHGITGYSKKANKKPKLHHGDFEIISDKKGGSQLEVGQEINSSGDEWGSGDTDFMNIVERLDSSKHGNNRATPKSNRLKSRRSISTPNLPVNSPNKFTSQQNFGSDDDPDPFGNTFDDLCANIPETVFVEGNLSENVHSTSTRFEGTKAFPCTSQRIQTPPSGLRRRPSPKDLSKCDDSFPASKKGVRKGRGNGKAKGPPKIKLPSRQLSRQHGEANSSDQLNTLTGQSIVHSHEEVTFTSQQPLPPSPLAESTNTGNSKSPMLNYSLIDTPILKQELKKYGIKPLPRSKAKVLLRHIYKETHK